MGKSLVSVIIPCYNHGEYLIEAVESVLASAYDSFEIIVVDDGSDDLYTLKLLADFSMAKTTLIRQENQGPSAARNKAISCAQGKYILPLDADDKINPLFIEKGAHVLDCNPDIKIVGHQSALFGSEEGRWALPSYSFPYILVQNTLPCACMFRKKDWEAVGGYNQNMVYGCEDWDFWLSLLETGGEVYQFDDVMLYYRKHGVSRTSKCDADKTRLMLQQMLCNHADLYMRHFDELLMFTQAYYPQEMHPDIELNKRLAKYKRRCRLLLWISIVTWIFLFILLSHNTAWRW